MRAFSDQPELLSDVLTAVAKRVKKVDLTVIEVIRTRWPDLLEPALAQWCRAEFVKNGVLIISVPSGAFAQQIKIQEIQILRGLASLEERAPSSIKTVQKA